MSKPEYQDIISEYKEQVRILKQEVAELQDAGKSKDSANKRTLQKLEHVTKDLEDAKKLGADCVEIHTGKLCNLINKKRNFKNELKKIQKAVNKGNDLGLEVHAGHGLTYDSAKILSKIKEFSSI